ncbi:TlpA family protein disulfide reductase [Chryseobacterium potabilaquae]|uniref:Thiol-disulfide oxidoreductase ResA n=1 Tax=Chryseobacterium potabilaquae TaxID=2675057 RepID=A0A6N4X7U1_9FLAO|nr:thioredoxin-like domain-containing protein [Chryseobacterium potabilaquae]CAA7197164.1 Thiol-disulfide oxidoreductase ResA [Chryseobacterium potabilaquae]
MRRTKKITYLFFALGAFQTANAQKISMYFPEFAGKTYDFVLFQGQNTPVQKGTIPPDGRFVLEVPKEYAPYQGMSRWLITNSAEGGGLDMVIDKKDFSVDCLVKKPSNNDIVYKGNTQNKMLDSLYTTQTKILDKFSVMSQAMRVYPKTDKNYGIYKEEYDKQVSSYDDFRECLLNLNTYASKVLVISNFTTGVGVSSLKVDEAKKAKDVGVFITNDMDWQALYTSGHWGTIIGSWVDIESMMPVDENLFLQNFKKIGDKLKSPIMYTSFVDRVTHSLTAQGKDDLIEKIAPAVLASQKITEYKGDLSVYKNTVPGSQAPDLMITDSNGSIKTLKSSEFADQGYENTMLVFYQWGCGHCESVLNSILDKYSVIEKKKIKIIAISGDTDMEIFKNSSGKFKWKDSYCDLKGTSGPNFKNYSVSGTPTIFLLDKKGVILTRKADAGFVLNK